MHRKVLFFLLMFVPGVVFAQEQEASMAEKLRGLFYDLHIENCEEELVKEIENDMQGRFFPVKYKKPICVPDYPIGFRQRYDPECVIKNPAELCEGCDSAKLLIKPVDGRGTFICSEVPKDKLFGHTVTIQMFFSDSSKANATYNLQREQIKIMLASWQFEDEYNTKRNRSTVAGISFSKKNKMQGYEAFIALNLAHLRDLNSLMITYSHLTRKPERCKNE